MFSLKKFRDFKSFIIDKCYSVNKKIIIPIISKLVAIAFLEKANQKKIIAFQRRKAQKRFTKKICYLGLDYDQRLVGCRPVRNDYLRPLLILLSFAYVRTYQ